MPDTIEKRLSKVEAAASQIGEAARKARAALDERERDVDEMTERAMAAHLSIAAAIADTEPVDDYTATELASLPVPPLEVADVELLLQMMAMMGAAETTGERRNDLPVYRFLPFNPSAYLETIRERGGEEAIILDELVRLRRGPSGSRRRALR